MIHELNPACRKHIKKWDRLEFSAGEELIGNGFGTRSIEILFGIMINELGGNVSPESYFRCTYVRSLRDAANPVYRAERGFFRTFNF